MASGFLVINESSYELMGPPLFCDYPNFTGNWPLDNVKEKFILNTCIQGPLCLLGLLGNTVALLVLMQDKSNKVDLFFLKVLAVADNCLLLHGLLYLSLWTGLLPFLQMQTGVGGEEFVLGRPVMYKFIEPLGPSIQMIDIWITVTLAVNRYIAVCHPMKAYHMCTTKKAKIAVLIVIISCIVFRMPLFFEYSLGTINWNGPVENSTRIIDCLYIAKFNTRTYNLIYEKILSTIFISLLPLILLFYVNLKMILTLRTHRRQLRRLSSNERSIGRLSDTENSISKVLLAIIGVFLICQTPTRILEIFTLFKKKPHVILKSFTNKLVYVNSSVNFIIYYFCREQFRSQLKKLSCRMLFGGKKASRRCSRIEMQMSQSGSSSSEKTHRWIRLLSNRWSKQFESTTEVTGIAVGPE